MLQELLNNLNVLISQIIDNINRNSDIIYSTLQQASAAVGYTMTNEMNMIWAEAAASAAADRAERYQQVTQLIEQMVAEGRLSREDADRMIQTLLSGDVNAESRLSRMLTQMVADGQIASADALKIQQLLGGESGTGGIKNVLEMYSKDFSSKSTTLNQTVQSIVTKVQELINAANANAQSTAALAKAQEEANMQRQQESAKAGEGQGSKDFAGGAVEGYGVGNNDQPNGEPTTSDNAVEKFDPDLEFSSDFDQDLYDSMLDALERAENDLFGEDTETPAEKPNKGNKGNKGNGNKGNKGNKNDKTNKGPQGDGKVQIGDEVTFVSGRYYYSSDGMTPTGYQHLGEKVYVGHINNEPWAVKPIALYSNKDLSEKHALGWVSIDQISGYKSGAKRIGRDQIAWTSENGEEYIVRSKDGAILQPLSSGDMVLDHAATENIWNMAHSPGEFIKDNVGGNSVKLQGGSQTQQTFIQNLENVTFSMPEVKNYDEFLAQMQHDKNFERLIDSMTIDRMAGKSSLSKYTAIRGK